MLFSSATSTRCRMAVWEGREHHGEILREATKLVEAGKIMPELDHRHFNLVTVCDTYRAISRPVPLRERSWWMSICSFSPANETLGTNRKRGLA
jgi:hypothetical protein